jgi:hypothetical protein
MVPKTAPSSGRSPVAGRPARSLPLAQQRQDEIDAERPVRQTLQPLDLSADELARKRGGTENAASTCVRDSRNELGAGRRTDARGKDGMLDPQSTAEVGLEHGASMLASVAESLTRVKLRLTPATAPATKAAGHERRVMAVL